jgi:signal transduction histidine kinase/ActR/RegA family two-component response regulator
VARKPETFFEEMKRYVDFTEEDGRLLQSIGGLMEPFYPTMAERFYDRIAEHPDAARVFTGGAEQVERLKRTLQVWVGRLFTGPFDEDYATECYKIGVRHVETGVPQRYMISAMGVVRSHLQEGLSAVLRPQPERLEAARRALDKILNLDLNMMCESYFQESIRNLSELNRKLERANLELAELSRVKTEFLATTSHELRTPLNSILGFTRLVLDGLCETREEERELLRDVLSSAEHLLSIVNDILDIGRIEAGKLRLNSEAVDLRPTLQEAKAVVGVQMAAKHLTLVDETETLSLPRIVADRDRIKQVLINLLGNAAKFTDKGWITLRARHFPERGYVELEVQDTGIGIPPERQRLLFQKFRQVDSSFTRPQGGSGLGLAISRTLLEMMGGRIRLWSAGVGCGTTVTFSLPLWRDLDDPVHIAGREALVAIGNEHGVRALIVDNDPEFRRYLKTALVKHGYYVLAAATADDAVDAARRFRPQVLVVDFALPRRPGAELGDGADVVAQLQTGALVRGVHCFMITGYDPEQVRERLALLQITPEILQKPIDAGKFLARLDQLLRRSAVAPPELTLPA